ncbi:TauD/TfdA family dioxygenase [Novosphingobium sp. ERW19]|uniref:TauD/TfdA dioxygenase family protein n=1 Tax=Novosphingobium sp. ERW19 TaxID=2726186 RepID=UPI0014573A8C|nr:TauD/TfdA family dioxygenase [Novosphingobium sp. ERW19]NLR40210.1 taurine dioxygenase [Novosphingobium sp. ERW19]
MNVIPVQPLIGAEITNVNLNTVDAAEIAAIRQALLRYKVLFLRDQKFDRARHVELGRAFGKLEIHPLAVHPDFPEILPISSNGDVREGRMAPAADFWHSDTTFRSLPSAISILRASRLPALGGDTLWANTAAVYRGLPAEVRDRINNLHAVHDAVASFARHLDTPEKHAAFIAVHPPQMHPMVRLHPETGEPVLYVNSGFTTHVAGIDRAESDDLLRLLFDEVKRPEYQVRLKWHEDTVAIWDNRSTQHYGVADYAGERHLERVTVIGDRPYGPSEKGYSHDA